ncbi:uncharacterized protein MAM_03236 [Metarhizium album ARSEF 1941]|uniref:Uncharacterized protein n=1 Tax=Metarhizium album (strain ARSEF 1941) TaxID=1081103 RepID=A0A0B2WYZ9_METAS|nr:uncharacterized protein MAM_03236 [Metarhizium album ARSEF 1941]KHN98774.1 hypothetical protein MAM_03236 [Metarhizium album ARSEF 1941]
MRPTPVRIRGKRKREPPPIPVSVAAADGTPGKMKRSLASVRASRLSRHHTVLESLPAELLETILLYSESLSLPRSSHLIGAKLSGRATLLRLFMVAFHDTWDQWFGVPKTQWHGPRIQEEDGPSFGGDAVFQSAMLELPWVDIDFILQAQQAWSDRYARDRWYQHSVPFEVEAGSHHLNHDHQGGFSHFNARDCFEADYRRALAWPAFKTESMSWGTHDLHPMTRLPVDLVTGPWDDEKKRRLFWLARGGLQMGAESRNPVPVPWETKVACLENAVINAEEPDPLIINCLIGNWVFLDLPEDIVRKHLVSLDRRLAWGGDEPASRGILRRIRSTLDVFMQLPQYHHMPA